MEVEQKKRGPKKKHGPREEFHLKFSPEVVQYIQSRSPMGVQAYFDELVKRDIELSKGESNVYEEVVDPNSPTFPYLPIGIDPTLPTFVIRSDSEDSR